MRRKNVIILVILLLFINAIFDVFAPDILGSQIDKDFLKSIDTSKITYQYTVLETHPTDDETGAVFTYSSDSVNGSDLEIMITVYKEESNYSPEIQLSREWFKYKHLFSFDTVTYIKKNNVEITIIERTNKFRSKNAQLFLEETLSFLAE